MNRAAHLEGIVNAYSLDDIDTLFQRTCGNVDFTMAVSYTHLDVYKRQVRQPAAHGTGPYSAPYPLKAQ